MKGEAAVCSCVRSIPMTTGWETCTSLHGEPHIRGPLGRGTLDNTFNVIAQRALFMKRDGALRAAQKLKSKMD